MIKWKVFLIILSTVILSFGIAFGIDAAVAGSKKTETTQVTHVEIDFSADEKFLGDKAVSVGRTVSAYDICAALGLPNTAVAESLNSDIAEISDGIITVKGYGELNLKITLSGDTVQTRTFTTVDGINITRAYDFYALADDYAVINDALVVQADIYMSEIVENDDKFYGYNPTFRIKSDMYGNGFSVYEEDFVQEWFNPGLIFSGRDNVLRDTRFVGRKMEEGDEINLDDFYTYGSLVAFGYFSLNNNKTSVTNCVFENANRNVFIRDGNVDFNGCLFRGASDSNVSIQTTEDYRASNVSFTNCVFADNVVAGITNWCTDTVPDENQCSITLKGFNDFYCWKNSATSKIVPANQANSAMFNGYIQNQMKTTEARKSLFLYDGAYYANSAILVICTGGNGNKPVITGLDAADIQKYTMSVDYIIAMFLTTSDFYGYKDAAVIAPDATIADDPYLYYDMKYGRENS